MAQIKKYQQGGSTSKKYGFFTIDNTKYNVDDDFINQLHQYGSTLRGDVGNQFGKIIDALKNGEDLEFSSSGDGTIYGNVDFNISDKQERRMSRARSGTGRRFGRLIHGKEQDAREAISALKNFKYNVPTPKKNTYDWSNAINIEYQKDKDGKYVIKDGHKVFIEGPSNLAAVRRLEDLINIMSYKDTDEVKGYNGLTKQAYIDFYNHHGAEGINNLINRIKTGTWSEADKLALAQIGELIDNEPTPEEMEERRRAQTDPQVLAEQQARNRYQQAGVNYDHRNIFGVDENGNVTITDPELLQIIGNGDAWLNNEFLRYNGQYSRYIPKDTGLFVINGNVYRGDDQDTLRGIKKYLDFVAENRRTAGNATGIKQFWGEGDYSGWSNLGYDSEGNQLYSPIFNSSQFGRDVSGLYMREPNSPYIFDYYPNYDENNDELFDNYGQPLVSKATRIYIDPITKQQINPSDPRYKDYINNLKKQTNRSAISNYYDNPQNTAFSNYINFPLIGNIATIVKGGNPNNPYTGYTLFNKPGTDMYYWYDENPGGGNYVLNSRLPSGEDEMRQYAWNIDPELGKYLQSHSDLLRDSNIRNLINDYIRNPYTATVGARRSRIQDYNELLSKYPELAAIIRRFENQGPLLGYGNYRQNYPYIGGSNEELRSITTPDELEARGLAFRYTPNSDITIHKQGGILKFQIGGVSSSRANTIKASKDNIQTSNKKIRKAGEEKVIGDGTDLNTADKAELAALVADAASLGATFVPVYGNAAGAAVGAVGSLTGFASDVAKDGLDWGDAGNLLLNLGLDAATLIPGLGIGAKAAKVAKTLKNSAAVAKWIAKGVSAGSVLSSTATAWKNIQDGKWTISDIRTIINGIRGGANFARLKGNAKTKNVKGSTITLKSKSKELPDIKLTKPEIESIENVPKNSRSDKLEELIISKLPKETKTNNIKDILSEYDINREGTRSWSWKHPFSINRGNTVSTDKLKYDEISGNYRNPNDLSWWNWNRRAAIRDAKTNRSNPYFKNFAKIQTSGPDIKVTSYRRPPITRPIYSNLAPDFGIFSDYPQEMIYYNLNSRPIFYKKGGKVIKAEIGTQLPFITSAEKEARKRIQLENITGINPNTAIKTPSLAPNPVAGAIPTTISVPDLGKSAKEHAIAKEYQNIKNPYGYSINSNIGNQNSPTGMVGDSYTKGGSWKINPDMFLGMADYITSAIATNRQANKMKDAIRKGMMGSQQQTPAEYYPRFSDNGLFRMYDDRINNIRQYKNVSSDPNATLAERYMREMSADQLANDRNTKFSQMISQYNDKMLGLKQQYANTRTQIVNENKNRWYQGLAQLDMVDANKIASRAQNTKNLIYQFRQDLAKDQLERQQAIASADLLRAQNSLDAELRSKFGHMFTPEMQKKYGTFNNFLNNSSEIAPYAEEIGNITNKHMVNVKINQFNKGVPHSWVGRSQLSLYEKRGGAIKRYREVGEQHYLDQQKAITKSINDLNNNIIKLFIKMMS